MRSRLRSTIKWGGTVLTVLLLVVWVGSAWWEVAVDCLPTLKTGFASGLWYVGWQTPWAPWPETIECIWGRGLPRPFLWWFDAWRVPGVKYSGVGIPIWLISVMIGVGSARLWLCDRRRAPGLCVKCGYDVRGNTVGVCPECGATTDRADEAA